MTNTIEKTIEIKTNTKGNDEKLIENLKFIKLFSSPALGVAALRKGVTTEAHARTLGLIR